MEKQEKNIEQEHKDIMKYFITYMPLAFLIGLASVIYDLFQTSGNIRYSMLANVNILRTLFLVLSILGFAVALLLQKGKIFAYYILYGLFAIFFLMSLIQTYFFRAK